MSKTKRNRPSKSDKADSLESLCTNTQYIENPKRKGRPRKNIENGNDQINEIIQPRRGRSKTNECPEVDNKEHKTKGKPRKTQTNLSQVKEVHQNTEKVLNKRLRKKSLNIGKSTKLKKKGKLTRLIKENSEIHENNDYDKPKFSTRSNDDNKKLELDIKQESMKKGISVKKSNLEELQKNGNNEDVFESIDNQNEEVIPKKRGRPKKNVQVSNFEETQENSNTEDTSIDNENEELQPKKRGRPKKSSVIKSNSEELQENDYEHVSVSNENESQALSRKRGRLTRLSKENSEETHENDYDKPEFSTRTNDDNEKLESDIKQESMKKGISVKKSNLEELQENDIEPDVSVNNGNESQALPRKRGRLTRLSKENSEEIHENDYDKPEFSTRSNINNEKLESDIKQESMKKGISVKKSNLEELQENDIEPDVSVNNENESQALPRKRGRLTRLSKKNSEEIHENDYDKPEFSTRSNINNEKLESDIKQESMKKGISVKKSNLEELQENDIEPDVSVNNENESQALPRKRGRLTRLSKKNSEEIHENDYDKPEFSTRTNDDNEKLESDIKQESIKEESPISVKKSNLEELQENGNNDVFESIDNQNEEQVIPKKRERPKKSVQVSNFEETQENSNTEDTSINNENEELQIIPKKRGRPKKNSVIESNSEEIEVKNDDEDAKKVRGRERKSYNRYSNNYDDSALNYNERIDYKTKVSNKKKIVVCDVCNESMTIFKYQKDHMAVHNYLCWLKGETPMDLKNEIMLERILNRAKFYNRKAIFRCLVCNKPNKSGRGYLSHIQFCGKTEEEKLTVMSPCEICGKLLMPASLDAHLYQMHNPNKKQEPIIEETLKARKAAEKCYKNLLVYNSDRDKKSNLEIDSDEFTEFYTEVKIAKKDYINEWTKAFLNDETVNCPCPKCDFKTERMTLLQEHFKICSIKSKCLECEFLTENEKDVVSHIKTLHALGVQMSRRRSKALDKNIDTVSELPYIPFVKYAEYLGKASLKGQNRFFIKALTWTKEHHALHYSNEKLFPSLSLEMDEWKFINEDEVKNYIQHTEQSIRINFKDEWFRLKRYETSIQDNLAVIFCGGPVFGLAWAPGTERQFLAIGAHLSMTDFYQVSSTCSGPGNIQIWSFGNMNNQKNSQVNDAKLEYLICHESRGAWSLDWCPSGCRDERMGLLAVGTASGSIIIFSIPMPNSDNSLFPACKPKPILNLEISPNERYHCTKVAWSKVKPHNTIIGGFANGYVAVWEVDTESSLLKKGRTIYPYKIFQAHHSIITGLCFSPMSNTFIVTSAHDKMIKYWDLNDTTAPISKNSRHLATDVSWLLHWMTCAYSIDNLCSGSEATMCFNSIRDIVYELQTFVSGVKAPATSISANDWLNGIALTHDNGQVNLAFGKKQPQASHDERKKYVKVIIEPHLYDFNNEKYVNKKSKNDEDYDWKDSVEYKDTVNKYGIHFKTDFGLGFDDNLRGNQPNPINIYPVITANKIAWNPNISSFLHMAVGYQNGLVILPKIILSLCDQFKVDEFYN